MVLQKYLGIHTYTLNFLSPKPKPPGLGALRLRPRLTVSEDSKVIESSQSRHEYKVNALCFLLLKRWFRFSFLWEVGCMRVAEN